MSPRPRKASDDDVFAATHRAMTRLGPGELTLADIAEEAGVTAGALVQRFGSKRDLLLALARRWSGSAGAFMTELRARHRSPLAALRDYVECMAQLASSPAALARNLAYLHIDLTDEDFRKTLEVNARATRAGLQALIAAAIAAGELVPATDPRALARTVETAVSGSLLTWATYREGLVARWMRADLDAVLAPYLARGRTTRRARDGRRRQ